MKPCPYCPDHQKFTNRGLKLHLVKSHKEKLAELRLCPHPFCGQSFPTGGMRAHWEAEHETWKLHDGRFVWEVLEEHGAEDGESLQNAPSVTFVVGLGQEGGASNEVSHFG